MLKAGRKPVRTGTSRRPIVIAAAPPPQASVSQATLMALCINAALAFSTASFLWMNCVW